MKNEDLVFNAIKSQVKLKGDPDLNFYYKKVKEKMDRLEEENKRLKLENERLRNER